MAYAPVSSAEDSPQVVRRRGGSLPIPMMTNGGQQYLHQQHYYNPTQRNSMYLSPNSSPPNGTDIRPRPKSNSYCEGTVPRGSPNGAGGMSLWLQRRHASTRSSEGNVVISGVVRQPRGPDGTKGFAQGYRQLIIKEKEETQAPLSALSA